MRLPFRRKDKKSRDDSSVIPPEFRPRGADEAPLFPPTHKSAWLAAQIPPPVLERIFSFVCPHGRDESYETCETSASDRGCMLCDLRDVSCCVRVNKTWRASAVKILYHSVRIDPVHYCKLEHWLAEQRKKTRFDRNAVPEDPARARLRLLRRTVRDDPTRLGKLVEYLKVPYMLRESSQSELAQTIAVLPNLKYVDLPEGMFSDEPSYATLRLEVQARCPNIRKMTYLEGSERSFGTLATGQIWRRLEVLELNGIDVDPYTMRAVLSSLSRLRALKVSETHSICDEVLSAGEGLPPLPLLEEIVLKDTPRLTATGIVEYLAFHETQRALKVLTLKDTGVQPTRLRDILTMATALRTLAIQCKVSEGFPNYTIQPLVSHRLVTLRYEISGVSGSAAYASGTAGYYTYLAQSILSGGLPKLRRLYVHDDSFPEQLQGLPPPNAGFAGGHGRSSSFSGMPAPPSLQVTPAGDSGLSPASPPRRAPGSNVPASNRYSSNNPFAQPQRGGPIRPTHTLEIFTKSDEFGKWNFAKIDPIMPRASPSTRRPVSSYGLGADVRGQDWDRGDARRSVMVGDGTGGFLALPGRAKDEGARGSSLGPNGGRSMAEYSPGSGGGRRY